MMEGCPTLGINEDFVCEKSGSIVVDPNLSLVKNYIDLVGVDLKVLEAVFLKTEESYYSSI